MNSLKEAFFNKAPIEILLTIYRNKDNRLSISEIQRLLAIHVTWCHTCKIIGIFTKKGLLNKQDEGRECQISITDEGIKIAKVLDKARKEIERCD